MKIIAYFDSTHDMPEEIVMAGGFVPYKITGRPGYSGDHVDTYLAGFFCPAARGFLAQALGESDQWEGIVIAHGCDATNRHFDIWKRHVRTPFLYWLNAPLNKDAAAASFFRNELLRLMKCLEQHYSVTITDQSLRESISISNSIKKKLRELGALRRVKDIPNIDYFKTVKDAMQKTKSAVLKDLDEISSDWNSRPAFPGHKKTVFLTGSDMTHGEFMKNLDDAGLRVVRDDLSIGERYYTNTITETGDPVDAIVDYHFTKPVPPTKNPPAGRLGNIERCLRESRIDGIVSQNLKFCEPFALDAPLLVGALRDRGHRVLHVERDFNSANDGQLINRLQAFGEML